MEVSSVVSSSDVGGESVVGLTGSFVPVGSVVNSLDGSDSSNVVGFVRSSPSGSGGVGDSPGSSLLLVSVMPVAVDIVGSQST